MRCVAFMHRDDDTGFGISFPDLPGRVAVGDTVDDAIRHGCEALFFHVEGLREYDSSRSGDVPRRLPAGFCGALHTDG